MNREQKRALERTIKKNSKKTNKKRNVNLDEIYIPEGTRVKLNIKRIMEHPDYNKLTDDYRKFVESNQDTIFTVEYDKFRKNPSTLVCLKEDPTPLKWLFWTGNLIQV